jgi:hypothetical protein
LLGVWLHAGPLYVTACLSCAPIGGAYA